MSMLPAFRVLGSGPTVLFLHGIGGGNMAFAPQIESFAVQGWRAVSWDMPGYGASAPIEPYTFKGLAESCLTLIDALRGPVILVGHSMGGMVAQEVVARRPQAVRALVLSGTSPAFGKPDGQWQDAFLRERTAPLDAGRSMAELAAELVPKMIGIGPDPDGVELALDVMGSVPPATYRAALAALLTFDRRRNLAQIAVPTLLLAGAEDRNAPPAVMKRMAEAVPGSEYLELTGVGHLANLEAPERFDGAVLNVLARRVLAMGPSLSDTVH